MGYTHYATRPVNNSGSGFMFSKLAMDAKVICDHAQANGLPLANGMGDGGTQPEFTDVFFSLNGVSDATGDNGHETFHWERFPTLPGFRQGESEYFDFCKTARKPYDAVVTAILIRAKVIYGSCVSISSDGDWEDWEAGRKLYEEVFMTPATNPMEG